MRRIGVATSIFYDSRIE